MSTKTHFIAGHAIIFLLMGLVSPAHAHKVEGHASYPLQEDIYSPAPNLFTGGFHYSIPVDTPSGRGGIQPRIALNYNSGGQPGWIGVDWDLSLGSIKRSSKDGVSYTADDYVLTLGGSTIELVNVATNEYREKYQTAFYRVKRIVVSSTNIYWEVTDKNGTRFFFGKNASSRQTRSATEFYSWQMDYVQDSNNNAMSVAYVTDQAQIYPSSIQYTSVDGDATKFSPYQVDFILENWGCDTGTSCTVSGSQSGYLPGYKIVTGKRLKTIKISGRSSSGGALSLIRAYTLTYVHSTATNRDRLTAVQQYGKDATINGSGVITAGTALPPVSLTYQASGAASTNLVSIPTIQAGLYGMGDFNGDSRGDIILKGSTPTAVSYVICLGAGNIFSCPMTGNGYLDPASAGVTAEQPQYVGDYNGDGRDDYLKLVGTTWQLCQSNFSGSNPQAYTCNNMKDQNNVALSAPTARQDFDNDARTDLYYAGASGKVCFSQGNGINFTCSASTTLAAPSAVADVDGDKYVDTIDLYINRQTCFSSGQTSTWVPTCVAFPSPFSAAAGAGETRMAGDFNGDSLTDIARYYLSGSIYTMDVCLSQGSVRTFDCVTNLSPSGMQNISSNLKAGDFNGDGRTDLLGRPSNSTQNWYYCLSNGGNSGFSCGGPVTMTSFDNLVGDYSGDGTSDSWTYNGITRFDGLYSDILTRIVTGIGARIDIEYGTTYDTYNTAPTSQLPYPVRVVKNVSVCDQWTASTSTCATGRNATTNYSYYGGYYHVPAAEFRGFAKVVVTTPTGPNGENSTSTTFFNQGDTAGDRAAAVAYLMGRTQQAIVQDNGYTGGSVTQNTTTYTYQSDTTAPYFNPPTVIASATTYGGSATITT